MDQRVTARTPLTHLHKNTSVVDHCNTIAPVSPIYVQKTATRFRFTKYYIVIVF